MKSRVSFLALFLCVFTCTAFCFSETHVGKATDDYFKDLFNSGGDRGNGVYSEVTSFGSNPGQLKMYKYVPASAPTNAPLVLVLHGCTQTAQEIAARGGWNQLADRFGFYILYPEQQKSNNQFVAFNWFQDEDIHHGQGECESIKQMIDRMKTDHSIDSKRIFVTGLSAGACFTAVLCCEYPEIFAAGSVMSGIPYRAAGPNDAFMAMFQGKQHTPEEWAKLVKETNPDFTGSYPRMVIFHGTKDTTVNPINLQELVKQFTAIHNINQTPTITNTVKGFPHKLYQDEKGQTVVETYEITGMAHGIALDPGTGQDQGGSPGSFALAVGLYSSYYTLVSWGIAPNPS
ncbi:MAG: PHB depolymerase family esterase [Candidatus Riflebacteria bacterium]|nr:PHB depolymerase family esterase [Candidatus Riflebacteria bacterium]